MFAFIELLRNFWVQIIETLSEVEFSLDAIGYTFTVSLTNILLAFFIFSVIISVFWKGART